MTKRLVVSVLALAAVVVLAGCGENGLYSLSLVTDGTHTVGAGEEMKGALVVMGGEVELEKGSLVTDAAFILGGEVRADGHIQGDMSIIGGTLALGPGAVVDGDLNVGGGTVDRSPQARVAGEVNTGGGEGAQIPFFAAWGGASALTGISPGDRLLDFLLDSLLMAVAAAVVVLLFRRPAGRVGMAAQEYPVVAGALGVLLVIMLPSLLVLMAFTLVLFPVVLLGVALLVLAVVYGWIGIGYGVGARLARRRGWKLPVAVEAFVGTLLFTLVVNALGLLPVVGSVAPIAAGSVGIGAAFLTRFGTRTYVPARPEPLPEGTVWSASQS
ncbi:MAG TPA: polymer-forming cytoskeletal protein [Chloroflexia bacterium]|nr:polymer-forming cytoskeletal protein [Chloroflexia bacterium]